jgi:hypothetical protein
MHGGNQSHGVATVGLSLLMVFYCEAEGGCFLGFDPAVKELVFPIGDEVVDVLDECLRG